MRIDGDTLEDFYERTHIDETRRKFLDGPKEGREGQDAMSCRGKKSYY
jgi:hypothetical protein